MQRTLERCGVLVITLWTESEGRPGSFRARLLSTDDIAHPVVETEAAASTDDIARSVAKWIERVTGVAP